MPDMSDGINYLALLVSAVAYIALGAIWYSPVIFAKAWMRGIGKTEEQVKADAKPMNYVVGLITAFFSAYGIARMMIWKGGDSIADGLMIALVAGVCFVFMTFLMNDRFEGRPSSLTIGNALYHVFAFLIMGIIIGAWR
jgi:hypothetical protein